VTQRFSFNGREPVPLRGTGDDVQFGAGVRIWFSLMIHWGGSSMRSMKILGALVLSLATTVAMAHAHLQKSVPADSGVVTASPANVVLSFSEPAHLTACWIQKGDGAKQKIGPLPTDPARQITVPLPQLAPGTYVVSWRVIGDDSHIVPGQIRFTVSAGTAAEKH
jgi:methionine-rich copper-binding protein CopC